MKILKPLRLCASFLLMSSYCQPAFSQESWVGPFAKQIGSRMLRRAPIVDSVLNQITARRMCTTGNNGNQGTVSEKSSFLIPQEVFRSWRTAYEQMGKLLQELEKNNGHGGQQSVMPSANGQVKESTLKLNRKNLAVMRAARLDDTLIAPSGDLPDVVKAEYPSLKAQEDALQSQDNSEIVSKMRGDLVNRIMRSARATHKINPQDVIALLDLYAALVFRPKEGITKVLNCSTNTGKSGIFNDVQEHAQSKRSDLEAYRGIYARLCEAFDKEAMGVVYQAAEEIMKEKEPLVMEKKNWIGKSWQDYISLIVEGADPLYPVQPNEVKKILGLYATLTNRPREGITRVLNYQTDTGKSLIYGQVRDYITQKGSDLEAYRNMYGRVKQALKRNSMQLIYRMIDEIPNQSNVNEFVGDQNQKSSEPLKETAAIAFKSDKYEFASADEKVHAVPASLRIDNSSDLFLETKNGMYRISKKEQERLNQVYVLLPESGGKSITAVLSGSTSNLSTLKAVQGAIEQIRQEALKEGDSTKIDLDYFKKLHWSSVRVTRKGGSRHALPEDSKYLHRSNFYDNFIETKISKKEQERLNRVYGLLPEYGGKSITAVLSGGASNSSVLSAVQGAIEQIRQEALKEGDSTKIDLDYFRELYKASTGINEQKRAKEESLLKDNKEKVSITLSNKSKSLKKEQSIKKGKNGKN